MSFPNGHDNAVDLGPMNVYRINGKYYIKQFILVETMNDTMVISPVHAIKPDKLETDSIIAPAQQEEKSAILHDLNYLIKKSLLSCILCNSTTCNGGQVNCTVIKNILLSLNINNRCFFCFGVRSARDGECNDYKCIQGMNKEPCNKLFCPKCFFVGPDVAHIKKCRKIAPLVTIRVRTALNLGFHMKHLGNPNRDQMAHADILKQKIGHAENSDCFCVVNKQIETQYNSDEAAKYFLDYIFAE